MAVKRMVAWNLGVSVRVGVWWDESVDQPVSPSVRAVSRRRAARPPARPTSARGRPKGGCQISGCLGAMDRAAAVDWPRSIDGSIGWIGVGGGRVDRGREVEGKESSRWIARAAVLLIHLPRSAPAQGSGGRDVNEVDDGRPQPPPTRETGPTRACAGVVRIIRLPPENQESGLRRGAVIACPDCVLGEKKKERGGAPTGGGRAHTSPPLVDGRRAGVNARCPTAQPRARRKRLPPHASSSARFSC